MLLKKAFGKVFKEKRQKDDLKRIEEQSESHLTYEEAKMWKRMVIL